MKHLKLIFFGNFFLIFFAHAQTDFSGNWVINEGKIDWKNVPHWILPTGDSLIQDKSSITIYQRNLDENMNEQSLIRKLPFDGSAIKTNTYFGKVEESLHWSADLKTFIIKATSFGKDGISMVTRVEIWSLENDSKTLVIERNVEQVDGLKYTITAYFDKK